jgi:hypothetical protein
MRRLLAFPAFLFAMVLFGGQALAAPEWCDAGSPPSNDFGFRPTGVGSATSTMGWLNSTTSGVIDLSLGINTLQGGVATGMAQALANAQPYDTLPSAIKRAGD